jgi:signal transduction histidine kinase
LYRAYILSGALLLTLQTALIVGLVVQRAKRRRIEGALRDSERRSRVMAEQNQALAGRLINAQEEERSRIARELHDNLSQQMALLANGIDQLAMRPGAPPATVADSLRELHQRSAEISTEIHNLSHRLHSSKLAMLGLVAAVRGHCREVLAQGVHAHFHDENVPASLSHEASLCLFRIVQEGLNNVVKHSGAREAHVTLRRTEHALVLTIADAGHGFDERALADRGGLGLASMRERLRLIAGDFTIHSQPGEGTTLIARVPIPGHAPQG